MQRWIVAAPVTESKNYESKDHDYEELSPEYVLSELLSLLDLRTKLCVSVENVG